MIIERKVKNDANRANALELDENDLFEICEKDFYPPQDDRTYESLVFDVPYGDTFHKYAEYFWNVYGHEIYDEI